eukprot:g4712.t1
MERSKLLRSYETSTSFVTDYSKILETFSDPNLDPEATPLISANHDRTSLKMFLSGGLAGAASKTFTAPFARLTILYQTHGFASLGHIPRLDVAFTHVIQKEGLRSLWKGNLATILHRIPYSASSFLVYEESLLALQAILPKEENIHSGKRDVLRRFLAGALASSCSTTLAYPIDLVRTRLAVQTSYYYKGVWDVLRRTYIEENVFGLYKGLGGSLVQVVPNVAVNLTAYETLRSYWLARHPCQTSPDLLGSVVCGGISGLISSTITYPIDLIRRRMQLQGIGGTSKTYTSYSDAIRKTWKSGGFRGFFIGITAEYIKVVPGVAMIYAFYEMSKRTLGVDRHNEGKR